MAGHSKWANIQHRKKAVDAKRVAESARVDDALCMRIWNEACLYLAIACINIQHAYNPARIVLGGGMADAGDFLLGKVTEHVTKQRWSLHDDHPEITLAELLADPGIDAVVLAGPVRTLRR